MIEQKVENYACMYWFDADCECTDALATGRARREVPLYPMLVGNGNINRQAGCVNAFFSPPPRSIFRRPVSGRSQSMTPKQMGRSFVLIDAASDDVHSS